MDSGGTRVLSLLVLMKDGGFWLYTIGGTSVKYRISGSKCDYLEEHLKEKWPFVVELPTFTRASKLEKGYRHLEALLNARTFESYLEGSKTQSLVN